MQKSVTGVAGAGIGFAVWLALWLPLGFTGRVPGLIDRLFLLAPLVILPLGFRLHGLNRVVMTAQPLCAALVALSFIHRTGVAAALLTVPWLLVGVACGLTGLADVLRRGLRPAAVCFGAALMFLPVGCVWLGISRLGANPLGFSDDIVLLTAVHFHYAGFAALTMIGMAGRFTEGLLYRLTAWGAITGIPSLALGITFSPNLECAAALLLVSSLLSAAGITIWVVLPRAGNRAAQALLAVSAASLMGAMGLAAAYALGKYSGRNWLEIPEMAALHGTGNAFGFALCGLLGWNLISPHAR
jgi:hypothetical protein